jgi:hypothetical protein
MSSDEKEKENAIDSKTRLSSVLVLYPIVNIPNYYGNE